jgi:hypothetical protein
MCVGIPHAHVGVMRMRVFNSNARICTRVVAKKHNILPVLAAKVEYSKEESIAV